jgi:putative ABC transport system ATP-binding protein
MSALSTGPGTHADAVAAPSAPAALAIASQGLQFQYPQGRSLGFADVALPARGTLLVQGPSGAGKSTWLALIAGLLTPQCGSLAVLGQNLAAMRTAQRDAWRGRNLGFLPQRLHLSPLLSVAHNLRLVYFALGLPPDDAAIQQQLAQLGVADLARRMPAELSGGQAQRVALARALLLQPRLIVADEPTASLDDEAAEQSLHLLQSSAKAQGASLVLATHDARVQAFFQHEQGLQVLKIGPGQP